MTQAPLATSPNAGVPLASTTLKKAKDMTPKDWGGLFGGLAKFFGEEAQEPEHAEDAAERTLYANRPLKNAADLIAWARKAGFKKTMAADDMHVTIAFSKTPSKWPDTEASDVAAPAISGNVDRKRSVEMLGDEGAIVLCFACPELTR